MTFGIKVLNTTGVTTFDSTASDGGVFVEVRTLADGVSSTIDYPEYAGRELLPLQLSGGGHYYSVAYTSGYPTLSYTRRIAPSGRGLTTTLGIFVR